jgi:hypothetical protein
MTVAAECLGKLVGLAPIYREDGSLGRRLLPLGISLSDYHDVLIDPGHIDDAWPAMIQRVFGTEHWEAWEWEELAPDDTALSLPLRSHGRSQLSNQSACPVLTFTGASLPECLPKRQRNALHLARNRAKRRGPLVVESSTYSTLTIALDHLIRLHGLRWQGRGEGTGAEQRFGERRNQHCPARRG